DLRGRAGAHRDARAAEAAALAAVVGARRDEPGVTATAQEPDLAHRASRGTLVTVGAQWSRTALQLVSTVVLARLLAPADFGLIAMVMAIVGLADLVREFGLSGAIVRLREIDDRLWAAIHRFSLLVGIVAAGLAAASAPL